MEQAYGDKVSAAGPKTNQFGISTGYSQDFSG